MQEEAKEEYKKDILEEYPKTQIIIGPDFFKRTDEIMRPYLIAHKAAKNPNIAFGTSKTREN